MTSKKKWQQLEWIFCFLKRVFSLFTFTQPWLCKVLKLLNKSNK